MSEYDVQFSNDSIKKKAPESNLPEKKIRPVTSKPASVKKKSGVKKLSDAFIVDDLGSIKDYLIKDILIPSVKRGISDLITNGIDMLFWGEAGRSNRSSRGGKMSYYNSIYDGAQKRRRSGFEYEALDREKATYDRRVVDTQKEAKDAIDQLNEIIDVYGKASIADYYEMIQVTAEWTDHDYGWQEFLDPPVVMVPDGWMIKMPKAHPLPKNR